MGNVYGKSAVQEAIYASSASYRAQVARKAKADAKRLARKAKAQAAKKP